MHTHIERIEFDATIDDVVDANMRMVLPGSSWRRARQQYQWLFGVCVAGGLAVGGLRGDPAPSYGVLLIVLGIALIGGLASGALGGRFHDWYARSQYKRVITELYRGADVIHCEFELRDDGFWCKSTHSETSFPWARLTRVTDLPGSIELWFSPGLAVIRDRAFKTEGERRAFLDAVRSRLPSS